MAAIILIDVHHPNAVKIIKDENGDNLVFPSWQEADDWLERNAKIGWVTAIHDFWWIEHITPCEPKIKPSEK